MADLKNCPDCAAVPDSPHGEGCDVARCPLTGVQRLQCYCEVEHGWGTWTGEWPGVAECREFGWWARWTLVTPYSPNGRPDSGPSVECPADHPDAHPALNRLLIAGMDGELEWDRMRERWIIRAPGE